MLCFTSYLFGKSFKNILQKKAEWMHKELPVAMFFKIQMIKSMVARTCFTVIAVFLLQSFDVDIIPIVVL